MINSYLRSLPLGVGAFGNLKAAASTFVCASGLAYFYLVTVSGFSQVFVDNHFNDIK